MAGYRKRTKSPSQLTMGLIPRVRNAAEVKKNFYSQTRHEWRVTSTACRPGLACRNYEMESCHKSHSYTPPMTYVNHPYKWPRYINHSYTWPTLMTHTADLDTSVNTTFYQIPTSHKHTQWQWVWNHPWNKFSENTNFTKTHLLVN